MCGVCMHAYFVWMSVVHVVCVCAWNKDFNPLNGLNRVQWSVCRHFRLHGTLNVAIHGSLSPRAIRWIKWPFKKRTKLRCDNFFCLVHRCYRVQCQFSFYSVVGIVNFCDFLVAGHIFCIYVFSFCHLEQLWFFFSAPRALFFSYTFEWRTRAHSGIHFAAFVSICYLLKWSNLNMHQMKITRVLVLVVVDFSTDQKFQRWFIDACFYTSVLFSDSFFRLLLSPFFFSEFNDQHAINVIEKPFNPCSLVCVFCLHSFILSDCLHR